MKKDIKKRGIAIKLVNSKGGTPAKEIINRHFKIQREKGSVWFSTAIPISTIRQIDEVLFVVSTEMGYLYVTADVLETKLGKEPFYLKGSDELIPESYRGEKKKTWLHISNMKKVDNEYADKAIVYYQDGSEKIVPELMTLPRINRAYYTWSDIDDEYVLL